MKVVKWEKLTRRGNNFSVLLISSVIRAYLEDLPYKKFGFSTPKHYRQLDGGRWFSAGYVEKIVKEFKDIYATNPDKLLRWVQQYQLNLLNIRKWTRRYKNRTLNKFSNDDLADLWEEFFKQSDDICAIVYGYIFINKFLPDVLVQILEKRHLTSEKKSQYLNCLLSLNRSSESKKEKQSLLRIVKKVDSNEMEIKSLQFYDAIDQHLAKYEHLGQYYYKRKPYTRQDVIKRIRFYLKSDYAKEIKELNKQSLNKYHSDEIIKKLKFNKKEITTVEILKEFAYGANSFDEDYTAAVYNFSTVIKESAKRLKIRSTQITAMACNELLYSLRTGKVGKGFHKELMARLENDATILTNGEEKVLSGRTLENYMKTEVVVKKEQVDVKIIRGQSAQPGLVRGLVHLVFNVDEVARVKKGEILVSPATMPSHVPAMERAKAIVTDEGGLLSHAAIVSRELGVPCIVGTKIGTQVLQNGDLIEVDANKGIITKI